MTQNKKQYDTAETHPEDSTVIKKVLITQILQGRKNSTCSERHLA